MHGLCNAAKVVRATKTEVEVHYSYEASSKVVGTLRLGKTVYTCDETQLWYRVFYSAPGAACEAGTQNGLPESKTSTCKSGWVRKKFIDVISG